MKFPDLKALLTAMIVMTTLLLPGHSAMADETDSSVKVCADGKPCPVDETPVSEETTDEEPTDEDLEDSCD